LAQFSEEMVCLSRCFLAHLSGAVLRRAIRLFDTINSEVVTEFLLMPVPAEYERASAKFYEFLLAVRDESDLWSTHVTYTMVQGVLQTFRRRLNAQDNIRFANQLPICLRALYVTDWDPEEPRLPFGTLEEMTAEVKSLRHQHNFSIDSAIRDVAVHLWRFVDTERFADLLNELPEGAKEFWSRDQGKNAEVVSREIKSNA